jgi:hypothetical protein
MDFVSAAECCYEIHTKGRHRVWDADFLLIEVRTSQQLSEADRTALISLLDDPASSNLFSDSVAIGEIENILFQYDEFTEEWSKICTEILLGKRGGYFGG